MKFVIKNEKEDKVVKAIRFPKELVEKLEKEAKRNGVSFTKFVIEACLYALENIER